MSEENKGLGICLFIGGAQDGQVNLVSLASHKVICQDMTAPRLFCEYTRRQLKAGSGSVEFFAEESMSDLDAIRDLIQNYRPDKGKASGGDFV